ncbi:MAG: ArdC-like ssDNA-binding domain-containing protein [Actinomycetia bacterium]|nr:ArdC-like ssDNA-binding domain-containing protein [Actinomycetes bacterium]
MSTVTADELHEQLLEQVGQLRTSEEWLAAMVTAARFHDYSLGNWLLMWSQAEQRGAAVTRPAGYRTWQKLGRQVRRGERGYRILAPMTRRLPAEDAETEEPKRIVTGFRVVPVFDVSQTDGEPLADVGPSLLTGHGDADLAQVAVELIEEQGYEYSLGPLHGPNGLTRPTTRQVVVEENLEEAQRTKTTVHELAHVLMHSSESEIACRGRIEVEAESVAYVVCGAAGLNTSAYSVAYVARWAETTTEPERTLLATAERIVTNARRVLEHFDRSGAFTIEPNQTRSSALVTSLSSDMMPAYVPTQIGTARKERV